MVLITILSGVIMQVNSFCQNTITPKRITIPGVKGFNWRNEIQQTIQVSLPGVWLCSGECESKGSYLGSFVYWYSLLSSHIL